MTTVLRHTAAAHQQYNTTTSPSPSPPSSTDSASNGIDHQRLHEREDESDVLVDDAAVEEVYHDDEENDINASEESIDEEDDIHTRHQYHHHAHDDTCGFRSSPSTDSITSADHYSEEINPNVEFFGGKGFWAFYIFFLFTSRLFIGLLITAITATPVPHLTTHSESAVISSRSSHDATSSHRLDFASYTWTIVNVLHTAITFIIIHWLKGTPFWIPGVQGRYDKDTFWEQIDDGRQYTTTRKILTLIPVTLFLLANYDTEWHLSPMIINLFALGFAVVPKHAALDHVRIFGINKD